MLTLYEAPIIIIHIQMLQTNLLSFLLHLTKVSPKNDQHQFSPNDISTSPMVKGYENRLNGHQRENSLIFYQILPTSSLTKYVEISQENLYVDTGG